MSASGQTNSESRTGCIDVDAPGTTVAKGWDQPSAAPDAKVNSGPFASMV